MNLWICGQRSDLDGSSDQWCVSGIFATEAEAAEACRDWTYFVMGPVTLGVQAPHELISTEKGYYPVEAGRPEGIDESDKVRQQGPAVWHEENR